MTYAWGLGAGVIKAERLALPGLNAIMQGMFYALYVGAGAGVGSLVGGAVMQAMGVQWMWGVGSLFMLAGWLVGAVVEWGAACVVQLRAKH